MSRTAAIAVEPRLADPARRRAAVVAASALLAMAVPGIFANVVVLGLVGGDPGETLSLLAAGEPLLRVAIVAFLLVAILDVVVAAALTRFFIARQPGVAALAGWMRVAYTAVLVAAVGQLSAAVRVAEQPELRPADANAIAAHDALLGFGATWQLGLVLFAAHLAVLALLVFRDREVPSVFGILLALAAAAYAVDGVAHVLLPADSPVFAVMTLIIAVPAALGELAFAVWLLVRGGRAR